MSSAVTAALVVLVIAAGAWYLASRRRRLRVTSVMVPEPGPPVREAT